MLRSFCMIIFSGLFGSPIVIFGIFAAVTYFSIDRKGSFDETSARTHVVDGSIGGLW